MIIRQGGKIMRRTVPLVVLAMLLGIGMVGSAGAHDWQPGAGCWGHMGPRGYGYGMGAWYGGCCWGGPRTYYPTTAITEKAAESIAQDYIGANPNLKVGKIEDKQTYFEAEIVTKEGSLVTMLDINKETGYVRPRY
jgi:hypothetical protein